MFSLLHSPTLNLTLTILLCTWELSILCLQRYSQNSKFLLSHFLGFQPYLNLAVQGVPQKCTSLWHLILMLDYLKVWNFRFVKFSIYYSIHLALYIFVSMAWWVIKRQWDIFQIYTIHLILYLFVFMAWWVIKRQLDIFQTWFFSKLDFWRVQVIRYLETYCFKVSFDTPLVCPVALFSRHTVHF